MNVRRTPEPILDTHPPDQRPQTGIHLRPAAQGAGFPAPIATKTGPMPAHDSLGPDDRDGLKNRRKPTIQQDEEKPITVGELDPPAQLTPQNGQLMAKRGVLR